MVGICQPTWLLFLSVLGHIQTEQSMRSWKSYSQNFAGYQSSWLSNLPASAIPSFQKTWVSAFQKNPHGWPGGRKDGQSNGRTSRVHWAGRIKSMWCAQTAMWKFLRPHSKTKSTWHNPSTCSTQKHARMSRPVLQQVTWTPVCITDMHIPKPISAALQSCSLFKCTSWLWLRVPMQKEMRPSCQLWEMCTSETEYTQTTLQKGLMTNCWPIF